MKNVVELRAHHILCSVLYTGHGYSDEFVVNMNRIVDSLRDGCQVKILCRPDVICGTCPNARADGGCALEDNERHGPMEKISGLDSLVLDWLGLEADATYWSSHVFAKAKELITSEFFKNACGGCRWNKEGLCSYDLYMSRVDEFITTQE